MSRISNWLKSLGLDQCLDAFEREQIDFDTLKDLSEADLRELGIPMGPRKKLLRAISGLTPDKSALSDTAGTSFPETGGDQRQVTVLFSDLSGFTKLSGEIGAEATHRLLSAYFARTDEIIAQFGGVVDKHIGDSVMGVFGAPVAHGNDPERAVRAAAAILDAMTDLSAEVGHEVKVHIGVASGQVVASDVGGAGRYTVTGSSVNLASRLTDRAKPGEVLMSNSVRDALGSLLAATDMGELNLKGIIEPVRAWRLENVAEFGAQKGERPCVGRDAELEYVRAALEQCEERRAGQVLLLRGEPGIGKTRLTEEVQSIAMASGYATHRVLILDFGAGKGQDAPRALVRSLLDLASPSLKSDRLAAAQRARSTGMVTAEQMVFLNDLLDLPQAQDQLALYDAMDNSRRNQGKSEVLASLVRVRSDPVPQLIVIEDLHWADALVTQHLAALGRAIADRPVLMMMTTRVEGDIIDAAWRGVVTPTPIVTLDLRPLLPADSLKLASEFFNVAAQFAQACVERADGNPLFLEQLLRGAEAASDDAVPGSIQSIVQARLDALDPNDKQALQAASVLGQRFDLEALRHVSGNHDFSCTNLIERHLIRPQGEMYLFAHALVREGVYGSLLTEPRRRLHRRAGEWYGRRDLVLAAEHLDRASDERAPRAYLDAVTAQSETLNFNEASRLAARGLVVATEPEMAARLGSALAEAQLNIGETETSIKSFRAALDHSAPDKLKRSVLIGLAGALRLADRREEALAVLDQADALSAKDDDINSRVQVHSLRGNAYFTLGRLPECMSEHETALELAKSAGFVAGEAQALGGLGDAHYLHGRMRTASESFQACVELAREHDLTSVEVANLPMVSWSLIHLNEDGKALQAGRDAEEMGKRVHHLRATILGSGVVNFILLRQGKAAQALDGLHQTLELSRQTGYKQFEIMTLNDMARAHLKLGNHDAAQPLAKDALSLARETGMPFLGPHVLGTAAKIATTPEERRCLLDEAEALQDSGGAASHNQLYFPEDIIPFEMAHEEWEAAARHIDRLERYTAAEPLPRASQIIVASREILARKREGADIRQHGNAKEMANKLRAANLSAFADLLR